MKKVKLLTALAATVILSAPAHAGQERWYTDVQVADGKKTFDRSCAGCHGANGEAAPDWHKMDSDGYQSAPPLNGTAHTWHHPLDVLRHTVMNGGGGTGGSMPAFREVLEKGHVDAVIAYVQSLWPDDIYAAWARIEQESGASQPADPADEAEPGEITQRLTKLLPENTPVTTPQTTPLDGIYEVSANGRIIYLDDAGRYAIIGDIVDLETGTSLTETKRVAERARLILTFPVEAKIVFPAKGKELAHIDVFTDTTCPYCRKLHNEIPQLQAAGISVRYLAFPRGGAKSQGYREMQAVWCDEDPVNSMHVAKTTLRIPQNDGSCEAGEAVPAGYQLGIDLGVRGTPAIVLPDGRMIAGYRPHANLISALGIE